MALRRLATEAVNGLGLRCGTPLVGQFVDSSFSLRVLGARYFAEGATVVDGLKYAKSHEYANVEGDVATVGISDFAQSELGDVVYVELPEVGSDVTKGETFGVVESVKAASDVYSPVSGTVVEVNSVLEKEPAKVNTEPFTGGWMMKVKLSDSDMGGLMDAGDYKAHCEDGGH